jgi:predicted transposase/invertase (TIGR01784 family)
MLMTEWNTEVAIRVSREEGREEGLEEGEARGEAKKQREIALKMLRRGTPLEYVMEDTGLPFAEIQFLQLQLS